PEEQCERFAECSQLRHLAIYQRNLPFTRVGLKALAPLKELRSLALGPLPRAMVGDLAKLPKLESLFIFGDPRTVRGLEKLAQLRWLSLGLTTFTKGILAQVLELPHLARLQLHLDKFEPGAIAALAKAPALRMLTVTVPDEQNPASELARVEQLQYLR